MEFRSVLVDGRSIPLTIALNNDTAATRAAVQAELSSQLLLDGAPAIKVRASRLREAVSRAMGESYHRMSSPADGADIELGINEYPVLGPVTWEAY